MKNINIVVALAMCICVAVTAHLWAQSSDSAADSVGWQHLALTQVTADGMSADLSRQINQLGNDGWELVDVENFAEEGTTVKSVYFFKRWQ